MSAAEDWPHTEWSCKADYMKCRRLIVGDTTTVLIDADVLRKAYAESPTLQAELAKPIALALEVLNERDGVRVPVAKTKAGRPKKRKEKEDLYARRATRKQEK